MMNRVILHCKVDNFYISVHEAQNNSLSTTAFYIFNNNTIIDVNNNARSYGISKGDDIYNIKINDTAINAIPADYDKYLAIDKELYNIYSRYSMLCEYAGPGKCFIDISATAFRMYPVNIAQMIISEVKNTLGLSLSIGISFNKLLAEIASDIAMPGSTRILASETFREPLWDLPVYKIPGITRHLIKKLNRHSIYTAKDIALLNQDKMRLICGKPGIILWEYACGIDIRDVIHSNVDCDIKSIGEGFTQKGIIDCNDDIRLILLILSQKISKQLLSNDVKACGIQIIVRDEQLRNHELSSLLCQPTQSPLSLARQGYKLFKDNYNWQSDIVSIALKATKIVHSPQNHLTDINNSTQENSVAIYSDSVSSLAHSIYGGVTYSTTVRDKRQADSEALRKFTEFFSDKSC